MIKHQDNISPAQNFFQAIDKCYELIDQEKSCDGFVNTGKWTFHDEIFVAMANVPRLPTIGYEVSDYVVHLKSVWVPHHFRSKGLFVEHLKLMTDYAQLFGVAIIACANPFDLATVDETATSQELRAVFKTELGFYYLEEDFQQKKLRQRERFKSAGFQRCRIGAIQNRQRIKKHDQLAFIPDTLEGPLQRSMKLLK